MDTPSPTLFTIRPARQADQEPIRALIKDVRINPMGLSWQRFQVAVAEDGRLIGCGQVKSHRGGARELASLAVVRSWRRRGVARAVVHQLQAGHGPPLWLTCVSNLIPFYEQFGFVEITAHRRMPGYFRMASRFFNLYLIFSRRPVTLAVMRWPGRPPDPAGESHF